MKHLLIALGFLLFAMPAKPMDRWPSVGGGGSARIESAISCARNSRDPSDCLSVEVVSTAAELDTCMQTAASGVCYVDRQIIVTESTTGGDAAFDWDIDATGEWERVVMCKDATSSLVWNTTDASINQNIIDFDVTVSTTTDNGLVGMEGCTVYHTVNGVPALVTGTVEAVVLKPTGSGSDVNDLYFRFMVRNSHIVDYATGNSTVALGVNPAGKIDQYYEGNVIYGAIGLDAKQDCNGCDIVGILVRNNTVIANPGVASPRWMKTDGDATIWVEGNTVSGILGLDCETTEDHGTVTLAGGNMVMDSTGSSVITFSGAGCTPNLIGQLTVFEEHVTGEFLLSVTGFRVDLDVDYIRCPSSAAAEVVDCTGTTAAGEDIPYLRLNMRVPPDCTLPDSATMVANRCDATAADGTAEADTVGMVKVGAGLSSTGAKVSVIDGATACGSAPCNDDPLEFTLTDDSANSAEVFCAGIGLAEVVPDTDDFDTGHEVAAYCGRRCVDSHLINGTDDDCSSDNSAVGRFIVQMN